MRRYRLRKILNAAIDAERTFKCKWPKIWGTSSKWGISYWEYCHNFVLPFLR